MGRSGRGSRQEESIAADDRTTDQIVKIRRHVKVDGGECRPGASQGAGLAGEVHFFGRRLEVSACYGKTLDGKPWERFTIHPEAELKERKSRENPSWTEGRIMRPSCKSWEEVESSIRDSFDRRQRSGWVNIQNGPSDGRGAKLTSAYYEPAGHLVATVWAGEGRTILGGPNLVQRESAEQEGIFPSVEHAQQHFTDRLRQAAK